MPRPRPPYAPPSIRSVPAYTATAGPDAIDFCAIRCGLTADPWQEEVLLAALAERYAVDPFTGKLRPEWVAFAVGVEVARQNGKGSIIEIRELAGIFLFGDRLITHTAHELKTTEEARLRMEEIIDGSPWLQRRLKTIVRSNGKEAIEWKNGARIKYIARSKKSGRGLTGDVVILDEAMFLEPAEIEALLPTLTTKPNPQLWYFGSAGMETSDQWRIIRENGLHDLDPALVYFAWCVLPEVDEDGRRLPLDLDDRRLWRMANPSPRVTERYIEKERRHMTDIGFARERLGVWDLGTGDPVIALDAWQAIVDRMSQPEGNYCFAVEVAEDRKSTSISLCGTRADGLAHIEVVDNRRGTGWAAERLADLKARWKPKHIALRPDGPSGSILTELNALGIEPYLVGGREYAQACGAFYDGAQPENQRYRHIDQPLLNVTLGAASKRKVGQTYTWGQVSLTDITPLIASTVALHAWSLVKAAPKKETYAPRRIR